MIELKSITKQYSDKRKKLTVNALNGISLKFNNIGLNFILGKSGCGKTTLLNIIASIDAPSKGSIEFEGKPFEKFSDADYDYYRSSVVGTIFQEYYLISYYTVGENIKFALDLINDGKTEQEKIALVNEYLIKVGLIDETGETLYNRKICDLSGGQKQRVAIARAIIKRPKILLADEPTGALDYNTGKEIFKLLKDISSECLVIVVTHDEEFANTYGDRIIRMQDGLIIEDVAKTQMGNKLFNPKNEIRNIGKLSFGHCFKIGARVLLHKRFRLAISMMCSILALIALGLCVLNVSLSSNSAFLRKAYSVNSSFVIVNCSDEFVGPTGPSIINQYDISGVKTELWKQYGLKPISTSIKNFWSTISLSQEAMGSIIQDNDKYSNYWEVAFESWKGNIEIEESLSLKVDVRFKDKSLCRYPQTVNEVAISDIKADVYIKYGFVDSDGKKHIIKTPDDLIGLKLSEEYTICGVFSMPESELIRNYPYRDGSYTSACVSMSKNSSINYLYVCPNFFESVGEEQPYRFIMPLAKGYASDNAFLKEMEFKDGQHNYFVEVYSIYGARVHVWQSFMSSLGSVCIGLAILFIVFSILLTLNFLASSISGRKKEFGILLSLGASKGTISHIFLTECVLIATINFVTSYIALWLISIITNIVAFKLVYFFVGFLPTILVLLSSIVSMGIASIISLSTIKKLTPKNIINAADAEN